MKQYLIIVVFSSLIISCGEKNLEEETKYIDGYWEIKSVEMGDGSVKTFSISTSVDYIQVQGDSGVRKKLMPRLDGSFTEFPTSEKFTLVIRNDSLLMQYTTPYASWEETVVKSTEDELIVKNREKKEFIYARFNKLDLGN